MQVLKRKSFYVLAVALILCLVMAFVPFTSKTALAEITDPAIAEGFTVKGAYVQLELGAEENPEEHTGKFALTFAASITEDAYNTAAAQGELKLGLLVGPTAAIPAEDVSYATLVAAGFKAISNVGSANSGASQQIVFTDGVADIEAGIVFDESKLPEGQLITASGLKLTAIPFVTYVGESVEDATDDTSFVYVDNQEERSARPIIHEMYIRSSNFDYEKYADDENKPVVITKEMETKFVVNVDDNSAYREKLVGTEIYLDSMLDALYVANEDGTLVNTNNLLSSTFLSWGFNGNNDEVYLAGVRHVGWHKTGNYEGYFTTLAPFGGTGNMIETDHIITKEQYTYGFTIFHTSGTYAGRVENFTFKAPTLIIKSGSSDNNSGLMGTYNGSTFNSPFGNSITSATDRYITQEIDGYYILANDIEVTDRKREVGAAGITASGKLGKKADQNVIAQQIYNDGTKGFTGVFDGRGFSIFDGTRQGVYNGTTTTSTYSLFNTGVGYFGWINGGTVKNVSFFNTTMYCQPRYGAILAYAITGDSLIENVYVRPLVYSHNVSFGPNGLSYEQGALLAGQIHDSTLRNVIVEHDFMDEKDGDLIRGINNYQLFTASKTSGNTFENVISLGNTPVSWTSVKETATITMSVNELPVIDETGTVAEAGVGYLLADYPVLAEAYGAKVTYIVNESYGPVQDSIADNATEAITVTFTLNPEGVTQFSGYRDLAAYVNNAENEAVKTALVNSGFYNVAESGFVTPANIPATKYSQNMMTVGYTYGNRVDDAIVVVFGRYNNSSNPLYYGDCYGREMVMANEEGKFIVDFSKYVDIIGSTGRVWVVYNQADQAGANAETFLTYEDCATATAVEVPAHDVTFQRISRTYTVEA